VGHYQVRAIGAKAGLWWLVRKSACKRVSGGNAAKLKRRSRGRRCRQTQDASRTHALGHYLNTPSRQVHDVFGLINANVAVVTPG
jgi:hypothetical protein